MLGHSIDANGVHATEEKIKAIVEAPVLKNLAELRSFLGLLNYYGRFIPNLSTLLYPLNELLRKETAWKWSSSQDDAFQMAKQKITSPNVLVHYHPSLPLCLAEDASACGIGTVISHIMPDGKDILSLLRHGHCCQVRKTIHK